MRLVLTVVLCTFSYVSAFGGNSHGIQGMGQEETYTDASDTGLPQCGVQGIALFQKVLYQGDVLGLCLDFTSKCVDLPTGWARMIESVYVASEAACYMLYTSENCEGMEMKINHRKVRERRTENLYDNNLAHRHSSIRVCNEYERTHH